MLHVKDLPLLLKGSQFPQEFIPEYIRLLEWYNSHEITDQKYIFLSIGLMLHCNVLQI